MFALKVALSLKKLRAPSWLPGLPWRYSWDSEAAYMPVTPELLETEYRAAKIKQQNKQWFISRLHGEDEWQQARIAAGKVLHGWEEHALQESVVQIPALETTLLRLDKGWVTSLNTETLL